MLPPLLKIIINEPGLLTEHLEAYSQLFVKDVSLWQASIQRQMKWKIILAGNLFLFMLFAGVAIMLWGTSQSTHWSLAAVPLIPLLLLVITALIKPRKDSMRQPFGALKKQFCSDVKMFKGGNIDG